MKNFKEYYRREKDLISKLLKEYKSDIESNNFEDLYKEVKSISFPSSLKQIDQDAFFNCNKLKDIRYEGTIKQLDSNVIIEIDGNAPLFENVIFCKDGKVIADVDGWTDELKWNRVK